MTHQDIYTKFMIEYDKANVTSSYPSLTEYEVATVLDKAYNALIAQKVTGNNIRRAGFESDNKAVSDLQPLIKRVDLGNESNTHIKNVKSFNLESDFLYFVDCNISTTLTKTENSKLPMDEPEENNSTTRIIPVKMVSHQMAEGFFESAYNMPWVKQPVCYIEDNKIFIVYDPYNIPNLTGKLGYIKTPNKFAKDISDDNVRDEMVADDDAFAQIDKISYFSYTMRKNTDALYNESAQEELKKSLDTYYTFECNDTVAEELISLAVAFALENIESQRLNSKLNMRGLEA